jgi:hypothetical protein
MIPEVKFMKLIRRRTKMSFQCMPGSTVLGLAGALLCAELAVAEIPEPDAVIYGSVRHRFSEALTPSATDHLSVIAKVNGAILAECALPPGTDTYLLRVPMDDGCEPRQPNTAKAGDQVRLFVRDNHSQREYECLESCTAPWRLPQGRAPLVALDLAVEANVSGTAGDSDGDGMPDYWEVRYGLDAMRVNGADDADGDGMTDLNEFLAGTNPQSGESKLVILLEREPGNQTGLQLTISPAISDRTYSIQVSTTASGTWSDHQTLRPTQTGDYTLPLMAQPDTQSLFFRVAVVSGEQ